MSHIVVERIGRVGYLTLDRPESLNALDRGMIDALAEGLAAHEADGAVEIVVVRSTSERAFCAGGDMKRLRELVLEERLEEFDDFFRAEYALNLAIARCPKPYVALLDGIAMGGGIGISVHGSHRVATERASLAMPEVRIGFFPDVGASHFLPRLPDRAGWWLGLTAEPVRGTEAVATGLATHHVTSGALAGLAERLERDADASVDAVIEAAAATAPAPHPMLAERLARRALWFAADTRDAIEDALDEGALHSEDAERLQRALRRASPHSIETTLGLLREGRDLTLAEALERERATAREMARHPDLVEGVRAVLVEKNAARWARRKRR